MVMGYSLSWNRLQLGLRRFLHASLHRTPKQKAMKQVPVSMNQDRWVRFLLADNLVPNLPPSFKMIWWTGLAVGGFRTPSPPDVDGFVPYRTPSVNT